MSSLRPSQGSHFYVLTVDKPGLAASTRTGTYSPRPGATRADAFQELYDLVTSAYPHLAGANVTFFALERNQL
ncbi:hypothetical protein ACFWNG_15605 [Streptomyces sp. NPDC058391]|uniref:hypothetical protein n=1 Tax=Streptomyces sp. NPDC058391 TaxID=3346476 RepID=UPI00364D4D68